MYFMIKKGIFLTKKRIKILMNTSLLLTFVSLFFFLGNTNFANDYAFSSVISQYAHENDDKTVLMSISANNLDEFKSLEKFSFDNMNNAGVYKTSILALPNETNELKLSIEGDNMSSPVYFNHQSAFAVPQDSRPGIYKLGSDNIFIERSSNPSLSAKVVFISKSIAEKIAIKFGSSNYKDALEKEVDLSFYNYEKELKTSSVFVRGVILEDEGVMPFYKKYYGDDIIMSSAAYNFEIAGSFMDVHYSQSIYRNILHTNMFLDEFGASNISFENNKALSLQDINGIEEGYELFVNRKQNSIATPTFISFLVLLIAFASFSFVSCAIYFKHDKTYKNYKYNLFSLLPVLVGVTGLYIIASIIKLITSKSILFGTYLSATKSITIIIFIIVVSLIVFIPKNNKKAENEKTIQ